MATQDINIKLTATDQTKAAFASAQSGLTRLNQTAGTLGRSLGAAFPVLGVAGIAAFAKSGIDAADALNDMSQRLGVSVKDLASFKLAAEQSGTSLDSVGAGIARLTKSIGEAEGGNKALAKALTDLGITARDPKEAFFQLADAVKRIEDPSKRAALLSQVLGKSYGELVPLLAQGSDELRRSADASESFADAMARLAPEADKFNDQLAVLKQNAAGAAATIIGPLVTSFNEYIAVMQEVIKTGSLLDKVRFFALGNASDEIVGRVRKAAEASAAAMAKMRALAPEGGAINLAAAAPRARAVRIAKPKLDEIDPFYRERTAALKAAADEIAETERMIADHLQSTNDAIYAQGQAWQDAGRALEDEMRTPLENANIEFARLDELLERGVITWETYARAVMKTQEAIQTVPEKLDEMDTFAKEAAEGIQNAFADFLFNPFESGLDGMLQSFGSMIQKMIAEAVAADLAKWLFGDLIKGGSGGGIAGSLLSGLGGLLSFAGGGYTGPGSRTGGVDGMGGFLSVLHPNETVVDHTKGQRSGHTIIVNVSGGSAPDVRRAAGQGAREALGMFSGAQRYA